MGRKRTHRGSVTPPNKASLMHRPVGIAFEARVLLDKAFYGVWGSLEGYVPCAYKDIKMIYMHGQGPLDPSTEPVRLGVRFSLLELSTVHIATVLFVLSRQKTASFH